MDSKPFLVESFINDYFFLPALFDSGCLPYAAFSENIVQKHKLPRIPVEHRNLQLAKNDQNPHKISQITYATLDINGRRERLWDYIIEGLHYDLILGKGWAERNHVIYDAKDHALYFQEGNKRSRILEKGVVTKAGT
ncbi:hypothetical protein K3495_g15789 [Podosphaera aphanis]|nr:hypothetical protein K3495_g15789 [Podosphaera aphanis]